MLDTLNGNDWAAEAPIFLAALIFGYLLGSIPFGLLITRASGGGDIRKIGSGNIGATNVLRTGKRWAAVATLLCDGGKGAVAVLVTQYAQGSDAALFAALGAFLGHLFPVWLNFKGGKGVATFLGVTLALDWRVGLCALATWLVVAIFMRISSLSALVTAALVPVYMLLFGHGDYAALEVVLALLVFIMHRENIHRLMSGTEPKIGATSAHAPSG
ncbi:MAG TPA: glycerol-3-phosphate 1-O-acyltransferase PlsY [Rhizomicrobium sp.]|nr:glycerol-3-phosphate 1-O-acyltransferase PlsY [Rhizomicrobium sp.]